MQIKEKSVRVFCNSCNAQTKHSIVAEKYVSGFDKENEVNWWIKFQIVECNGCENVTFRCLSSSSEDFDPITGEEIIHERIYPEKVTGRSPVTEIDMFPSKTRKIYIETIKALNSNLLILSAIGLRALIESICLEQGVSGKNLEDKIEALAKNGLLSEKQAKILHTHRFLGNIAAHQIEAPNPKEIIAALEIAEILLKTIYVIPELNASIKTKKK
jgi:hypothetical protein